MGLNDYLGVLVKVDGTTSISIILLVDAKVESLYIYIYIGETHQNYHKVGP
jgi:hypothetical protein